jgi:hypothetical protein
VIVRVPEGVDDVYIRRATPGFINFANGLQLEIVVYRRKPRNTSSPN